MTKRDDGGPAFPRAPFEFADKGLDWAVREQSGMSLRDWFAGQALAGSWEHCDAERAAVLAYAKADAMLAVRGERE